ncbi:hypothetical protein [Absidia glauca]|uniref:Uncharacterized protein n=1 Tax=Absidia glauca TaxID=4829 RepID=A0A163JSB6_ABSGL|nr:hypothetical protein [Absidia glauca]
MPIPSSTTSPFPSILDDYDRPPKKHLQPTPSPSSLGTPPSTPLVKRQQRRQQRSLLSTRPNRDAWVNLSDHRIRNSQLGNLHAGSRFTGSQKCGDNKYDVVVDIQNVNLDESTLCGYLNIKGLTTEFPELTTYFEGEIIGPKYSFLTRKWQAQHYIDVAHWKRFPSFQQYISVFNQNDFVYEPQNEDFIYMRWKEKFLVPDHHVDNIEGASFAGFYYVCFQRSTNTITGMYFYRHFTQWYQELALRYDPQRSFGCYEFR